MEWQTFGNMNTQHLFKGIAFTIIYILPTFMGINSLQTNYPNMAHYNVCSNE